MRTCGDVGAAGGTGKRGAAAWRAPEVPRTARRFPGRHADCKKPQADDLRGNEEAERPG